MPVPPATATRTPGSAAPATGRFAAADGNGLRRARRSAGFSLAGFAAAMSVSMACVSRWETDVRRPHSDDLRRISTLLAVDRSAAESWFRAPVLSTEVLPDARGLRAARLAAGLTRAELAGRTAVSVATVAHWECGRRALPAARWPSLAAALGLGVDALVAAVRTPAVRSPAVGPLTALRRRSGLTQRQVGARLGVSGNLVSQWERGLLTPSWPNTRRLALLLATPLAVVAPATGRSAPQHLDRVRWRHEALGPVLREVRLWRGESRAAVAGRAGVDPQTLHRWESGRTVPAGDRLGRLESALGLPRATLPRR